MSASQSQMEEVVVDQKNKNTLLERLSGLLIGQEGALETVVPYIELFSAGLAPDNRPVGIFLLLGPTGVGKTKTVEVLAEILQGNPKHVLKIDCGEYQLEHEVAKLIGAPPGYLGHTITPALLSQNHLTRVTTEECGLSIVVFDEIEKAAPSVAKLLLGIFDKGILCLGDNTKVNFEKSLIFLTSNLGAKDMIAELTPFGLTPKAPVQHAKLNNIGMAAVKRKFSPEFINRIDNVITYKSLTPEHLALVCDLEITALQTHIGNRLGHKSITLEVPLEAKQWMVLNGTSAEYGARELKRVIHKNITRPLASMLMSPSGVPSGSIVVVELKDDSLVLTIKDTDVE